MPIDTLPSHSLVCIENHLFIVGIGPILTTIQELDHKQPKTGTPIKTDNSTAHSIVHNNLHQKKSRCFDTGFHWIRDRAKQCQFDVKWKPGPNNKSDYVTKHHPLAIHREMSTTYLYVPSHPTSSLRGCVNTGILITVKLLLNQELLD